MLKSEKEMAAGENQSEDPSEAKKLAEASRADGEAEQAGEQDTMATMEEAEKDAAEDTERSKNS
mgnify:CR=1 FL=1